MVALIHFRRKQIFSKDLGYFETSLPLSRRILSDDSNWTIVFNHWKCSLFSYFGQEMQCYAVIGRVLGKIWHHHHFRISCHSRPNPETCHFEVLRLSGKTAQRVKCPIFVGDNCIWRIVHLQFICIFPDFPGPSSNSCSTDLNSTEGCCLKI